jgi:hypothetical protein
MEQNSFFEENDAKEARRILQSCDLIPRPLIAYYLDFCKQTATLSGNHMKYVATAMVREALKLGSEIKLKGLEEKKEKEQ